MIPIAILLGLLLGLAIGAWWWAVPAAAAVWVIWLVIDTGDASLEFVAGAFLLGAANAAVGVALGQGLRLLLRRLTIEGSRPQDRRHPS